MEYLLTPFQVDVLQEKLLVLLIVYASMIVIMKRLFLLHSPLRVEEASLEQTKLFLQEATPA